MLIQAELCTWYGGITRIGQCIGRNQNSKIEENFWNHKTEKIPDFARNQEFSGGDYWTRTSDLLRVKICLDVNALLSGAFR